MASSDFQPVSTYPYQQPSRPEIHSETRSGLSPLVGRRQAAHIGMCPQHAGALDERKLSKWGRVVNTSFRGLSGIWGHHRQVSRPGADTDTLSLRKNRMGKGKRKVLVLKGKLPGLLTQGF